MDPFTACESTARSVTLKTYLLLPLYLLLTFMLEIRLTFLFAGDLGALALRVQEVC